MIIIADDLTGASDSAVPYKENGFSTIVEVLYEDGDIERYKEYDILSINADTRWLDSRQAYEKVYSITRQMSGIDCIYKKIDSVLRGNPASELDAVMDAMNCRLALVAPSFPENGRIVCGGILAAGDLRIDAVELFAQGMERRVEGVLLDTVRKGTESLEAFLREKQAGGTEVFVLDACTDEDLKIIKETAKLFEEKKVLCGSAGFAKQVSGDESMVGCGPEFPRKKKENNARLILAAIGSRSVETACQVKRVSELFQVPIVQLETKMVLNGCADRAVRACMDRLTEVIGQNGELALVTVDSLFRENETAAQSGREESEQAMQIVEALGKVVKEVYNRFHVEAIISTGGDTSLQICKAFCTSGIELLDEIAPGIPIGRMVGGEAESTLIVTKSGGFGIGDALVQVIEYIQRRKQFS